ncbi:MAG: class II aldolase/adducin family protein [Anaerolineae bacterium]|nr:class II aldolase/adducin family protein [Anaerolineae bacterium]
MSSSVTQVEAVRRQMVAAARAIVKAGAISRSGHGNMSVHLPGTDTMLLTNVMNLEDVTVERLPLVTLGGRVIDGELDPVSAEVIGMHAVVYEKNPDMGAVVHTHAPYATAYAVADRAIECWYEGLARFGLTDPIPVAKYGPRGSRESVTNIADAMDERTRGVLLQNHGVLTFEQDLMGAVRVLVVMEEAAELGLRAHAIGGPTLISREAIAYAQQRAQEFAAQGTLHAEPPHAGHSH